MKTIPDTHKDILQKKAFAHLCTLMADGSPQASPVWVDQRGDHIIVNSAQGRVKDRNIRRDPRVAISVTDPENPYRCLMIRGEVVEITLEGAQSHIDDMARKYIDKDKYPYRTEDEVRVIYVIEPKSISAMG